MSFFDDLFKAPKLEVRQVPSTASSTQKATTTQTLTPEQQALIKQALPGVQGFQAPQKQVADFNPTQIQGQQQTLAGAGAQQGTANSAQGAFQYLTAPDILSPESNPALQGYIDSAVRPIYQNLTDTVLPQIRGEAVTSGQYGGSRQGIAEGLAARGASDAAASATADIANKGYQSGLTAMNQALTQTGEVQGAQTAPGQTVSAVGDVGQAQEQAKLDADFYNQFAPYLLNKDLLSIAAGLPGGSTTTTGSSTGTQTNPIVTPGQPSDLQQAIGLASSFLPLLL